MGPSWCHGLVGLPPLAYSGFGLYLIGQGPTGLSQVPRVSDLLRFDGIAWLDMVVWLSLLRTVCVDRGLIPCAA